MRTTVPRGARWWTIGLVVISGLAVQTVRVQQLAFRPYLHENLYLPSGRFVKELSLGYDQVAADLIWLEVVQYYGGYRQEYHGLGYFKGLIDIITMLDPHFIFAYEFGALVVSEDLGEFDAGIDILKRGMAKNPTSWRLPFEIGFLNYVHNVNFDMAARYFALASKMPGAPENARRFAAFAYAIGGRQESAIQLWQEYMEHTDNPLLKELAQRYIERIRRSDPIQPWRRDGS